MLYLESDQTEKKPSFLHFTFENRNFTAQIEKSDKIIQIYLSLSIKYCVLSAFV